MTVPTDSIVVYQPRYPCSKPPRRVDPLQHPMRRRLFEIVALDPGMTFRQLAAVTACAHGTVRHHLGVLQRHGLLRCHRHRSSLRFFLPDVPESRYGALILLRDPGLAVLLDWLRQNPGSDQSRVVAAMRLLGWSRSTTQHRLHRLLAGGAAAGCPMGRRMLYTVLTEGERLSTRGQEAEAAA